MKNISLFEHFNSSTLRDRETIRGVINNIDSKEFILDFKNIKFISKSFAHELMNDINKKDLNVEFINVNEDVNSILKIAFYKPTVNLKLKKFINLSKLNIKKRNFILL